MQMSVKLSLEKNVQAMSRGGESPTIAVNLPMRMKVSNLNFYYGNKQALFGVSLGIAASHITALIGPSGCGKSTLLRTLNRLHEPVPKTRLDGEILLDGENIFSLDVTGLRRRVGMVFQKPNPFPKSIFENVAYGLRVNGHQGPLAEAVEHSLQRAALWEEVKDQLHKSAYGISGGQQQRLCIARSLAVNPDVLLMDEPCSALDPTSTRRIEQTISELAPDVTIVIVTHNMQQAARVSQQCAFFLAEQGTPGGIVEAGTTKQIFEEPRDQRTSDYVNGRFG